ncbi:MAG: hypothetical protein NZO58_14410, partial [Gemmataceae bacterium]|nr:hypothetical protein [Gemmataceae bacterium]
HLFSAVPRPRVVVLADVPRLTEPQRAGLNRFVEGGGGLLVVLGPRVDREAYNEQLFRDGRGWLPARLEKVESVKPEAAPSLDVQRFLHPALELFKDEPRCTLGQAAYPQWWKVQVPTSAQGSVAALLTNGDPWLISKGHGLGHVLLSTLPMDASWGGRLPKTWEFPVLVHELLLALAEARGSGFNVRLGEGLRLPHAPAALQPLGPVPVTLFRPDGGAVTRTASAWPFVWHRLGPPGLYAVQVGNGPRWPVVVHADPGESDLTPASAAERRQLAELMNLHGAEGTALPADGNRSDEPLDLWQLFIAGVVVLLCCEVWLTRRLVLARGR